MANYNQFLDSRKPTIQRTVDDTLFNLRVESTLTNDFFPLVTSYTDWRLLWTKVKRSMPVASVVGTDGQVPAVSNVTELTEFITKYFKIGLTKRWLEEDQRQFLEFQGQSTGLPAAFINEIFMTIDMLTLANVRLANVLIWQVAATGLCDYLDPRTNIRARLQYPTESTLFPSALTGTEVWDDYANAQGLDDLENLSEAFYTIHGRHPEVSVGSRSLWQHLRQQQSTKDAYVSMIGSAANPANVTVPWSALNELLEMRNIPPIYYNTAVQNQTPSAGFDDIVEIERLVNPQTGETEKTYQRLHPENKVTFLTRAIGGNNSLGDDAGSLGEQAFGPTVEGNGRPGFFTNNEEKSVSPPIDELLVVGNFVPAIWNSKLLCSQQMAG